MRLTSYLRAVLVGLALHLGGHNAALAAEAPGAYSFRSYGPEQGLRNQAVTGLAQDRDGFLFVATEDGLFRYDGNRFQRFGISHGLLSDSVVAMYREPGGRLWIISGKGALAWSGLAPDPGLTGPLLPDARIDAMAASATGHLLIGTADGVYEGTAARLALVPGLPRGEIGAVWIGTDGNYALVAAQGKLYQRQGSGPWQVRALPGGYRNESIHSVLKDSQGRIWIRGRRVLLRLAAFDGAELDLSARLPGAAVTTGQLLADAQGGIWAPSNLGLARFDDQGVRIIDEQHGLPGQFVNLMLIDREGNLWIASEGVHRLQGRQAWTSHTRRQKLPSDTVWNVTRTSDGLLWAGTNRGLAYLGEKQWEVWPGTEERTLYAFAQDKAGNFWVTGNNAKAAGNTLLLRAAGTSSFRSLPLDGLDGPSTVNSMAFGPDGALYLATQSHGVHQVKAEGTRYVTSAVALPGGDAKEQINLAVRAPDGVLWMSAMGGLASFDGVRWRRYGTGDGLRENHVEAMAFDSSGEMWIGYWNLHGLSHFKPGPAGLGKVSHVDQPADLVADNIYSLGFDSNNALWLGTAQGAKRWKNGQLDQFGRGEGLPSDDASANAFFAEPNGDVWFGMASGLAHFQAAAEPPPPPLPVARVLRLQDGAGTTLAGPAPEVDWQARALTFHFATLSFINEARVRTQVRLVGFEDNWRDTEIHEARYTGLPPGNYRFEVRASAGGGQWGPAAARAVRIAAPWWRTGWALALMAVLVASLVLLFVRWRLGYLHRRNTELEALVHARTEALEHANAALQEASMVDPLTGLKNRRFLGLSMPDELARVSRQYRAHDRERAGINKSLLFFMIDIDHFKLVNDTYGHAAGDLLLQHCSNALRKACRDADFVVRWGGEEFLIVARNSDRAYAELLANNLRKAIRELRVDVGNGATLQKTCSIGFAAFPVIESAPDAHPWEDVIKMADQCLYAAKLSGRDAWVGLVMGEHASDPGARMGTELGAVVAEGRVQVVSSLPDGTPLRWQ
ncbi:ligand-binding sensor domain-containing diguanylate cyclase [Massilia sp. CF038]|uniref:ligand-binding sensor domain-containing diguanylate cyclase n=1 Tax=Massilia sp. CF038 TaxID=1881045 RepID=UPI00091C9F46|nr:ligand-binding sensor domain-containing diguanylate cyclase [Massilia sp. CF038]SHG48852.1 diguanylate cyclase (GGDEF) domain-containing protein [Massilia sp. CF038]